MGESAALTEVLALRMHVCLGPADGPIRRDIITEMVPTAFRSGDEHLVSVALFWATADAHLVGAPDANRRLPAFRERLALVDNAALRYVSGLFFPSSFAALVDAGSKGSDAPLRPRRTRDEGVACPQGGRRTSEGAGPWPARNSCPQGPQRLRGQGRPKAVPARSRSDP
jgi:hypothetical protein